MESCLGGLGLKKECLFNHCEERVAKLSWSKAWFSEPDPCLAHAEAVGSGTSQSLVTFQSDAKNSSTWLAR